MGKVLTLMEDALHSVGKPLSSQEIFDFVIARRPVKKSAIDSYLSYENRFTRVDTDLFSLSDWGMPSVGYSRISTSKKVFSKAKLCEYIELVFSNLGIAEMFVSELAQEISIREQGSNPQAVYNSILKSPAVTIKERIVGKLKRKIAIFQRNYKSQLTKLEILSKDLSIGELIQNSVRDILNKQSDKTLELATIRDLVSTSLHCPPSSVYNAIRGMEDVEKINSPHESVVCKLKNSSGQFIESVNRVKDGKLQIQLNRALDLANIDSIDLALFQLGKIFEFTLKRYMQEVQSKNAIPVTNKDMERLHSMIEWVGKNNIIVDETALHFLRIERNDRGHGTPPDLDERQALLNNASTLIKIYLDYIVVIENRRERLGN